MAGEVTIDRLSIEINANAGPAVDGIRSLATAVREMSRDTTSGSSSLETLAEKMRALSSAFQSSAAGQLGANLQRGATNAGALAAQLGAVTRRTNEAGGAVETLRNALGSVGTVAATTGKAFAALPMTGFKAVSGLAKGFAGSVESLFKRVTRMFTRRVIRKAITATFKAFSDGVSNVYQWSKHITGVGGNLAKSLDKIATAALYVKNSLGAMLAPLIETAAPIIDMLGDKLARMIDRVSQFLAALTGKTTYTAAKKLATEWDNSEKSVKRSTDKIKRYTLNFDELNIAGNKDDSGNKTPDYGAMFETRPVESSIKSLVETFKGLFEPFKKAWDLYGATTVKAAEDAFERVRGLVVDVGKTLAEVWRGPAGLDWLVSTLGLFNTTLGVIGDIAQTMRTAWNDNGAGYAYISSIFGLLTNVNILLQTIGDSFRTAWNNSGYGISIMSYILSIATAINDTFSNLAGSITRAWEAGGVGVSIWNGVLSIIGTVLERVNDIVVATKNWAAALDFGPLFGAFDTLLQKIQPVVDIIAGGLAWAWEYVLLPLGKWTIEKALPAVLGTLSGAFEALNAVLTALQEPATWIWNNFLEPVASWTGGAIVTILDGLNTAFTALADWINENRENASWLFDAVTGFLIGITTANVAPGIITAITSAFGGLAGGLGMLVAGFDPVRLAIAGVITVGYLLVTHWDEVKELAGKLGEKIAEVWGSIRQWTTETWGNVTTAVKTAWDSITGKVAEATENVKQWIFERFDGAKTAIVTAWSAVSTWTTSTWTSVSTTVQQKAEAVRSWVSDRFEAAKEATQKAWTNVSTWTTTKWNAVSSTISSSTANVRQWITDRVTEAGKTVSTTWTNVSTWTTQKWDSISGTVKSVWDNISRNATTTFNTVKTNVVSAWNTAQTNLDGFVSWIGGTFAANWDRAWNGIVDGFGRIFGGLGDLLKGPVNTVINMINGMIGAVESAINAVVDGINSHLSFDFRWEKPSWMGGGYLGFSWSPNLQRVSWGRVNYLAEGGILDVETLLGFDGMQPIVAGEAGREVVLPLDSNTGWMDDVAARINQQSAEQNTTSNAYYYNSYDDEHIDATDVSGIERALRVITKYLERIERKDTAIEVSSAQITKAQNRSNRRSGVIITPVGT